MSTLDQSLPTPSRSTTVTPIVLVLNLLTAVAADAAVREPVAGGRR